MQIVTDRDVDSTLWFMQANNKPQAKIDQYLKDQADISEILMNQGGKTFEALASLFDHDISLALSYLVKSEKISFTIPSDGNVIYWDWGDY